MVSLKEKKRLEKVKKSQAAGAATRAENVRKAGEQKERALESGGRFSEGGEISTVTPTGGKKFKIDFSEKLSFSEGVRVESRPIESQRNRVTQTSVKTEEQQFKEDIKSDFSERGEVGEASAPPLVSKEEKAIDNFLGKNISFERVFNSPDFIQAKDTAINFGRDLLSDPFFLGSAGTKPAIDLSKSLKEGRSETSLDLAFEGKLKESFEKEGARASLTTALVLGLSPLGGKSGGAFKIDLAKASRQKQIEQLQFKFPELKGTAQIIPEKSLVKTEFVDVLGGKKSKAIKFKKTTNIPQGLTGVGDEAVILGGATEGSKAAPLFVVKFGKGKTTISQIDPKQTTKVIEGAKAGEVIQLTKEAKIAGGLSKTDKKLIGAEKEFLGSDFRFTAKPKTSTELINLQKGLESGTIKQFAEVKTTNLENVLKGKSANIKIDIQKPPSVFAQTKAEKILSKDEGFRNVGKPSTPLDLGGISSGKGIGGSAGKVKQLTQQEVKIVKDFSTPTKIKTEPKKETLEILFAAPRFTDVKSAQASGEQILIGAQEKPTLLESKQASGLNIKIIEGSKQSQAQNTKGLLGSLGFRDTVQTDLTQAPKITQAPIVDLRITDDLVTKITTTPKPPPTPPNVPTILTPPVIPPEVPKIPIVAAILPPPISSRDFDTPSKPLGKKKGFFGNVPLDAVVGIVRKAPTITISEGRGFRIKQFTPKKEKRKDSLLGLNIKIGLGSSTKRGKKTRQKKNNILNIYGSSKAVKIRL